MIHDFHYISKRDPYVKDAYDDLMSLLKKVRKELKSEYTFQHRIVGSYSRNMMTYDEKGNVGPDFDVNIYPNDENSIKPKTLKLLFKSALDKHGKDFGFEPAEDSTRVLTIKQINRKESRVIFSVDFCIVKDYIDYFGKEHQKYIRYNKIDSSYVWEEQPQGYYQLPEKIEWLKKNGLWQEVREQYIRNKNRNYNPDVHSRTIFANTVNQIYQISFVNKPRNLTILKYNAFDSRIPKGRIILNSNPYQNRS